MNDLYIHQLEIENKQLREQLQIYRKALEEEITTKKKAIEYIKENANYGIQEKCCLDDLNYYNCDELLEILGDKENENN